MPSVKKFLLVKQQRLTNDVFQMDLQAATPLVGYLPGRFVMVAVPNGLQQLRRPLAIAAVDEAAGKLSLIYRVVGQGTAQLAALTTGEQLSILGALGNGFATQKLVSGDQVLLVGGGTGLPPLMYLAQILAQKGCSVTTMVGFRTKTQIFGTQVFAAAGKLQLATDDGSAGIQGNVGTLLAAFNATDCQRVFACGPLGLLKAVQQRFAKQIMPVELSLESRMGCGMGACAGCMVSVGGGTLNQHICQEGPIFSAAEVQL
ncbi:MAG: dihydroorotate dehydrogenase electron transfer subunit [Liquorilactobacillus ghanensis]|uniref:dihydroorotate dehydrogenase electron transfer subunit n=1 Tax=Liquorilactobacillus ghanensis TaxID=399370 RepID=UPI0039EC73A4